MVVVAAPQQLRRPLPRRQQPERAASNGDQMLQPYQILAGPASGHLSDKDTSGGSAVITNVSKRGSLGRDVGLPEMGGLSSATTAWAAARAASKAWLSCKHLPSGQQRPPNLRSGHGLVSAVAQRS